MILSHLAHLLHTARHWQQELLAAVLFLALIPIGLHALSRFPSVQEAALTHLNRLQEALFHLQLEQQRLRSLHVVRLDAMFPLMSAARYQSATLLALLNPHADLSPLAREARTLDRQLNRQLPALEAALRAQTIALTSHRHFSQQGEQCLTRLIQLSRHDHDQLRAIQHYYLLLIRLPFQQARPTSLRSQLEGFDQAINRLLKDTAPPVCQTALQHGHQMIHALIEMDQRLSLLHLNQLSSRLAALRHELEKSIHRAMVSFNGLIALALLIALMLTYLLVRMRLRLHHEARNMAERTRALERLNQLYDTLLSINHALLNTEKEETLSHLFAQAFTRHMGLPAALVFHLPPHASRKEPGHAPACITLAQHNPILERRLKQLRLHPHPQHPDHLTCLRQLMQTPGHVHVIDRLDRHPNDPNLAPWQPLVQTHGLNHLVFLSLHRGGESQRHIIVLLLREEDRFCEQARKLIHNALAEAGYALENLHIRRMRDQQQAFLRLTEAALNTHEGLAMLSREGEVHWTNEAFTRLTGYQKRELLRRSPAHLFDTEGAFSEIVHTVLHQGRWQGRLTLIHKTGQRIPALCTFSRVHHQKDLPHPHIVLMVQDMRPIQALEDRLQETLSLDPVTKLPNRQTLIQQLTQLIQPDPEQLATGLIAVINLRDFRSINDSLGIHAGDHFLQEVARRLKQLPLPHLTGRDHNDEFILAPLTLCDSQADATRLWETLNADIRQALSRPFHIHGTTLTLQDWYAGVTFYTTRRGLHFDTLVQEAETAVRKARTENKPVAFYSTVFNRAARRCIQMSEALIQAIERNDFTLHYQPIVSCHDQRIRLCEALLRWRWNDTPVSPEEFIPLLESRPALMIRTGQWILKQAIADMARLNTERPAGHPPIGVSINVSGIQLQDASLPDQLAHHLQTQGLPPDLVTLEITESTLIEDVDTALNFIERCRKTGVEIAIDDFGTGYSSLKYLQAFNADKIKLDKVFVQTLDPAHPRTRAIPEMTISMAHTLGARLVAEGIETTLQYRLLREMGCDYLQGFLFGRGMPLEELTHLIRNKAHDSNLADHRHTGQRQDHTDSASARPASSS